VHVVRLRLLAADDADGLAASAAAEEHAAIAEAIAVGNPRLAGQSPPAPAMQYYAP
jgi:DNA-binding FadR family transcriptional regulator